MNTNSYSLRPYVRLAMYDQIKKDFYLDRVIWDHEIIYIAEGKMIVTVEGNRYECVKGDIIFLKPRTHHILEYAGVTTLQPHVHFDFLEDDISKKIYIPFINENKMTEEEKTWFREDYLKKLNINLPPVIRLNNSLSIKNILYRLIDEFSYHLPFSQFMLQALLIELITEIIRSYNVSEKNISKRYHDELNQLVKFIHDNIDQNLSLDDLAKEITLSKWHLIRIFKESFEITPIEYVTKIRLKRARELVQYSDMPLKEIALQMNFESQQTFSRWFKQLDGSPPITYRMNLYGRT